MAFPMIPEGMRPKNTKMEFHLRLIAPGVDNGCKGQVDNSPSWERQYLFSLMKSDDLQGSSVLCHTESSVLPLLAEAAHGRSQLDGLGTKQGRRIPRSVWLTALQFSDQRWRDVRQRHYRIEMQHWL